MMPALSPDAGSTSSSDTILRKQLVSSSTKDLIWSPSLRSRLSTVSAMALLLYATYSPDNTARTCVPLPRKRNGRSLIRCKSKLATVAFISGGNRR